MLQHRGLDSPDEQKSLASTSSRAWIPLQSSRDQLINAGVVQPSEFPRLTHPSVDDSAVVGRNDDVSMVRDMSLGSGAEDDLSVVAIVGMAGLGKDNPSLLSYSTKTRRLLNEMMQSLTGDKSETPNIERLVRKLDEELNGKKYLLVLDDVGTQDITINKNELIQLCMGLGYLHPFTGSDFKMEDLESSCLTLETSEVKNHQDVQHLSLNLGEETRLVETPMKKLPISMRKFIHLRYFDLSNTKIEKLPNFITSLYNLETLRLPSSLQELPKEIHKLVSLRHLCMDEREINLKVFQPMIGHLTSLQTLPCFVVDEDMGHRIEELGSLN
ncbi:uncharacterized protein LOC131301582 [Rhododendron vialii]|uniref:uncharacterized protein LOC131301582 n=1 Tax=Rhododendron vialii TaxID=182163 RepID=UPI00265E196B|nr:uncharacterized protein LOC131301582 [Rhododendron vialii]